MSRRSEAHSGHHSGRAAASAPKTATIVVPLDGSTHSLAALPVAKVMAGLEDATLHVIHVGEPMLPPRELLQKLGLTPEQLRGSVVSQVAGTPAAGIVQLAREWHSLFIVLCTLAGAAELHAALGPIAEEVLRSAPCPVVLVRPQRRLRPWELRRILLPHDGTPTTAAAVGPAADLAQRANVELDVLHVAPLEAGRPAEAGTFAGPHYMDQAQHEWPTWAREFMARLRALGRSATAVKMRLFLGQGEPGAEIVRFAAERKADLIVLGWRGRLEVERAATFKAVLRDTPCPVLIVRVAPL